LNLNTENLTEVLNPELTSLMVHVLFYELI